MLKLLLNILLGKAVKLGISSNIGEYVITQYEMRKDAFGEDSLVIRLESKDSYTRKHNIPYGW